MDQATANAPLAAAGFDAGPRAAGHAVAQAVDSLPSAPALVLAFTSGLHPAVANSLSHEVSALLDAFPAPRPPLTGLFTHGEVARLRGAKGDLNHAVVAVAFG